MKTTMTFAQSVMKLCQLWSITSVTVILDLLNIYLPCQDYFTTKVGSLGKKERRSDVTQFGSDLVVFSCDSVSAHVKRDSHRFRNGP